MVKTITVQKSTRKRTLIDRLLRNDWHDVLVDGVAQETRPSRGSALWFACHLLEHDPGCREASLQDDTQVD